jgi:hypothetical protein
LVKLIKNNEQLKNNINYNFINSNDYIKLINLFNNLLKFKKICEIDKYKIDGYIKKIEQMIIELKGFGKSVLKEFRKSVLK